MGHVENDRGKRIVEGWHRTLQLAPFHLMAGETPWIVISDTNNQAQIGQRLLDHLGFAIFLACL